MVAGYTTVDDDLATELNALKQHATTGRETGCGSPTRTPKHHKHSVGRSGWSPMMAGRRRFGTHRWTPPSRPPTLTQPWPRRSVTWSGWPQHGNPALVADIAEACGALRAAVAGARTNMSFELGSLTSSGEPIDDVRHRHPALWETVQRLDAVLTRIDRFSAEIEGEVIPCELRD
jgi:hypothetical protein